MGTAPCARALANEALSEQIREVFVASDATYGMPRVRAELTETGVVASGADPREAGDRAPTL